MSLLEEIKIGMKNTREFSVTYEDTAEYIGNPGVKMLSTPSMIKYMELTSGDMIFPHLPKGHNPVGTMVCIKHLAPTPVAGKIRVHSELIEINGKRLTFQVAAYHNEVEIGSGSYEQFIVDLKKFLL